MINHRVRGAFNCRFGNFLALSAGKAAETEDENESARVSRGYKRRTDLISEARDRILITRLSCRKLMLHDSTTFLPLFPSLPAAPFQQPIHCPLSLSPPTSIDRDAVLREINGSVATRVLSRSSCGQLKCMRIGKKMFHKKREKKINK